MTYRCEVCGEVSDPIRKRQVYYLYKQVNGLQQIARELPVCDRCKNSLDLGMSLPEVAKHNSPKKIKEVLASKASRDIDGEFFDDVCDICDGPVGEGQRTADSVICDKHLPKPKARGK